MAKKRDVDLGRLCAAMQRSRMVLRRYRQERREAVRQYAGKHWGPEFETKAKVPVNLLALYASVVGRNLIARNPRVMLSTFDRQNKAPVAAMQSWCNERIEEMRLAETLQRVVLDALFSVGITKVALAAPADAARFAWKTRAGEPFAERVDLDDWVFDVPARAFEEVSFMGHRYRVPLEVIRDSSIYGKGRKDLSATEDNPYNLEGDERIGTLGRGVYAGDSEEFEPHVDLWEVYIPRKRLVVTLADNYLAGAEFSGSAADPEPLRQQEWLGPDTGPYHILSYGVIPGNAMPKAPIQDLIDLHELVNNIYRKLTNQAERQKEILGVAGGAMEDGSRVQQASDGEIIRTDRPESMKPLQFGGPSQHNLAFGMHAKDLFGYMAGNLDMMGGLSPQSKTLGQDQMLQQNASRGVADMQDTTVSYTGQVAQALCWYWWHHPVLTMRTTHSLPGMPDISTVRRVTAQQRMHLRFDDLGIKVDPYSLQHSTPQSRVQALNQVVQQIIAPMMGLLQQQGIALDLNTYLSKLGQYLDMPDLADIITIQEPTQQEPGGGGQDGASSPARTTRTYQRQSLAGQSPQAKDASLMAMMQGGTQKGAETQGMMQQ